MQVYVQQAFYHLIVLNTKKGTSECSAVVLHINRCSINAQSKAKIWGLGTQIGIHIFYIWNCRKTTQWLRRNLKFLLYIYLFKHLHSKFSFQFYPHMKFKFFVENSKSVTLTKLTWKKISHRWKWKFCLLNKTFWWNISPVLNTLDHSDWNQTQFR